MLLLLGEAICELGDLDISCSFCVFFYELFYCCALAGMARVRITAKDITEGASLFEERDHLSEGEEDLSNVDADPSELMKKDRPAPTLRFGPSAMSVALIESVPQAEETPNPEDG